MTPLPQSIRSKGNMDHKRQKSGQEDFPFRAPQLCFITEGYY